MTAWPWTPAGRPVFRHSTACRHPAFSRQSCRHPAPFREYSCVIRPLLENKSSVIRPLKMPSLGQLQSSEQRLHSPQSKDSCRHLSEDTVHGCRHLSSDRCYHPRSENCRHPSREKNCRHPSQDSCRRGYTQQIELLEKKCQ